MRSGVAHDRLIARKLQQQRDALRIVRNTLRSSGIALKDTMPSVIPTITMTTSNSSSVNPRACQLLRAVLQAQVDLFKEDVVRDPRADIGIVAGSPGLPIRAQRYDIDFALDSGDRY